MLCDNFMGWPIKRRSAAQPFIDDDAQGILVAGRMRVAPNLFWSHIGNRTERVLMNLSLRSVRDNSNAKIAQQHLIALPYEKVLRFDVSMDQFGVMRVLEGVGNLFDVGDDNVERK